MELCAGCGKPLLPGDEAVEVERRLYYCVDSTQPLNGCALRIFVGHSFEVELEPA